MKDCKRNFEVPEELRNLIYEFLKNSTILVPEELIN
jgi:hypothetical protein